MKYMKIRLLSYFSGNISTTICRPLALWDDRIRPDRRPKSSLPKEGSYSRRGNVAPFLNEKILILSSFHSRIIISYIILNRRYHRIGYVEIKGTEKRREFRIWRIDVTKKKSSFLSLSLSKQIFIYMTYR